jgi:hypothetical protein
MALRRAVLCGWVRLAACIVTPKRHSLRVQIKQQHLGTNAVAEIQTSLVGHHQAIALL